MENAVQHTSEPSTVLKKLTSACSCRSAKPCSGPCGCKRQKLACNKDCKCQNLLCYNSWSRKKSQASNVTPPVSHQPQKLSCNKDCKQQNLSKKNSQASIASPLVHHQSQVATGWPFRDSQNQCYCASIFNFLQFLSDWKNSSIFTPQQRPVQALMQNLIMNNGIMWRRKLLEPQGEKSPHVCTCTLI